MKKYLIFVTTFLVFLCCFLSTVPTYVKAEESSPTDDDITLKFGMFSGPSTIDPHKAYDRNAWYSIHQSVETLFEQNLTDPELGIIPRLASAMGTWSPDGLNYTVSLNQDILFHDGTSFDAAAVKWNFERLAYFMNIYETLPSETQVTQLNYLYRLQDGTPIINKTVIINPLAVRFILNEPYAAFEALLSFSGSGIVSPSSTSQTEYIDTLTGDLVGTGPFVYDKYIEGANITYHSFKDYYAGIANIDNLTFSLFTDSISMGEALSSGEIQFFADIPNMLVSNFTEDPNITVESGASTTSWYLSMNNEQINKTMRQAISYAINYSYIIDVMNEGYLSRLKSPLPEGILYANSSFNYATTNVTEARKRLVGANICDLNIYLDSEWETAASSNPIAIYNYTYLSGTWRSELANVLEDNLAKIGIMLLKEEMDWMGIMYRMFNIYPYSRNMLQLFDTGWGADFNDPINILNSLFYSNAEYNYAQVDDPYIDSLLDQASVETDSVLRENLYDTIQAYLLEDLMPYAYLWTTKNYVAYNNNFTGFLWNALGIIRFRDVVRKVNIETPKGTDIEIVDIYHDLNMTFTEVTDNGSTLITSSNSGIDPETGFGLAGNYYNITTTAEFTGTISIALSYEENEINCDETELKLMHYNSDLEEWVDITTSIDLINNLIYGETSSLSTFSIFQPDETPPTTLLTLVGEEGQENWFSSDVYIILSAEDALSDLETVEYQIDNGLWNEYSELFPITTVGETMIHFRSTDSAGNVEPTKSTLIKIDKTSPETTITVDGTLGGDNWYTSEVTFEFAITDDLSGVAITRYSLDSINWYETSGPVSISTEGYNTLYYFSLDKAGNIEEVKSEEFKIDTTAPETTTVLTGLLGLEDWFISNVTVSFTVIEDFSGLLSTEYSFDGVAWYEYFEEFNITQEGITTLFFKSTDVAGNVEITKIESVSIDYSTPLTELIISPVSNSSDTIFVNYESSFILVGTDSFSGISKTYYRINESDWRVFNDFFNITGPLGEYVIEYYSVDVSGNIESVHFTTVELVESFGEEFQGFGMLRISGQRIVGFATMTITSDTIQMEIEDQTVEWEILDTSEYGSIEIYHGENDTGWITAIVIRRGDSVFIIAFGTGIFFIGCS